MMELMDTLFIEKDTSLTEFDEMRFELELTTKKEEIIILDGCFEIIEVIKGFKITKKMRKPINKKIDIENWINLTSQRYNRYDDFIHDSSDDYPEICKNIVLINRCFKEKIHFQNMIKIVYKTDKKLIKLFKDWNLVE